MGSTTQLTAPRVKEQLHAGAQRVHRRKMYAVRTVKPCKVRVLWRTGWEGNLQEMVAAGSWAIKLENLLFLMKTKVQLFAFTSSPPHH